MWLDLAKFRHYGIFLKYFGYFIKVLLSIWQSIEPTLDIFYAIGQIFIVVNCQKMKQNLPIWSHCSWATDVETSGQKMKRER